MEPSCGRACGGSFGSRIHPRITRQNKQLVGKQSLPKSIETHCHPAIATNTRLQTYSNGVVCAEGFLTADCRVFYLLGGHLHHSVQPKVAESLYFLKFGWFVVSLLSNVRFQRAYICPYTCCCASQSELCQSSRGSCATAADRSQYRGSATKPLVSGV